MNSIEEDIKILEGMIEEYKNCSVPGLDMRVDVEFREKQCDALEHILSDYKKLQEEFNEVDHECDRLEKIDFEKDMKIKELQKENEELEEINNELEAVKDEAIRRYNFESIPVSLVEEKIEWLEVNILDNEYASDNDKDIAEYQVQALQELIKESEE